MSAVWGSHVLGREKTGVGGGSQLHNENLKKNQILAECFRTIGIKTCMINKYERLYMEQ